MPYRDTCLSLGRLTATLIQCTDSFQNLVVPCPARVPTITEQWTKWAVQKVLLCIWNVFRTIPLFWRSLSSPTKASGALYPTWSPCTIELITTITKKNQWLTNSSQLKTCFQSPRKFTSTPSERPRHSCYVTEEDEKYGLLPFYPVLHIFSLPMYTTDAPQKIFMSSHSNTSADKFNITFPGVGKK